MNPARFCSNGADNLCTSLRFLMISTFLGSSSMVDRALADWINLTGAETAPNIAEIYVLDDRIKLVLEVYLENIDTFRELVPDDWLKDQDVTRPDLYQRLRSFSDETFQFITDSGDKLQARVNRVEPRIRTDRQSPYAGMINPLTRQRVPESPKDKRVLYAELVYPFARKPQNITIIPPLDEAGSARITIGFIAYHKAVPVIDFRYLGAPAHLSLNWEDPWYSKFVNPNLKRHHKSALMSFLYVEPYEVRHEILTRVKDMEQWMDLELRGREFIELDELDGLKQRIGEYLIEKNPVRIDGQALPPILDRSNYVQVGLTGIQLIEQPQRMETSTAIVGVILTYLTDGLPQEVTVNWELFSEQIQEVPATATDPAGPLRSFVTPEDSVHRWTNFLKRYKLPTVAGVTVANTVRPLIIPLATMMCLLAFVPIVLWVWRRRRLSRPVFIQVGLGVATLVLALLLLPYAQVSVAKPNSFVRSINDAEAKAILEAILRNVYRAFDFRAEEHVYDKLALSVSGDLLSDIYLQSRKSLQIQKAGGAQAKVKAVEVLDTSVAELADQPLGFALKSRWTALGTVGHWGHVHARKNLYEAIVTLQAIDGIWKITGLELLEEQRIDPYAETMSAVAEKNSAK